MKSHLVGRRAFVQRVERSYVPYVFELRVMKKNKEERRKEKKEKGRRRKKKKKEKGRRRKKKKKEKDNEIKIFVLFLLSF